MNRKFIAIITALALVVTLLAPVGVQEASAASKNKVDRVPQVTSNYELNELGLRMPKLLVEVDDNTTWADSETFRVQLPDTAEWVGNGPTVTGNVYSIEKITDQIIEVTTKAGLTKAAADIVEIPLDVKIKSSATGEQKLTINNLDSRVTGGSYTFAIVNTGDTVVTVGSKKTAKRGGGNPGAEIIIDETSVGALAGQQKFTVKLPSNIEWDDATEIKWGNITLQKNNTRNGFTIGDRDLTVTFNADDVAADQRRTLVIKPVFTVTRDAKYGEITASITSSSSSGTGAKGSVSTTSDLLIAEYKDFGVEVEVKEVKEFLAGYHTDDYRTAKITIKETIAGSLIDGRVVELELPSWVKLRGEYNGDKHDAIKPSANRKAGDVDFINPDVASKGSILEYTVSKGAGNGKAEIEIELPIVVEGTQTGDITLNVKGAGIEAQEVVIGKAVAPVTAEVKLADVRLGVQGQDAPEIIIEESVAGAIRDKETLDLKFVDSVGFRFDSAKFEVIEGDIEIDVDKSGRKDENKALEIYVKSDSSKPSKIRVYDIKLTVDRTAPEGPIKLDLAGQALVNYPPANSDGDVKESAKDYYKDFAKRIARFDFANVITPAPGETRGTVVFTIDSTTYTAIEAGQEVERTMDVAPYIKDSRTFLPVFFVAQSLGVAEQNIVWEPHTKTVTIYKGDRIAQMQIGSKTLVVNGTAITMDTAPEIKDGRTMLPIYYVGQALGASVEWDGDARTVTVNQ